MPNLNSELKRKITKKTNTIVMLSLAAVWVLAIIFVALTDRYDEPLVATAIFVAFLFVTSALSSFVQRRIAYWVRFSYHAGGIASAAITYKQNPDALRELADLIEKENLHRKEQTNE